MRYGTDLYSIGAQHGIGERQLDDFMSDAFERPVQAQAFTDAALAAFNAGLEKGREESHEGVSKSLAKAFDQMFKTLTKRHEAADQRAHDAVRDFMEAISCHIEVEDSGAFAMAFMSWAETMAELGYEKPEVMEEEQWAA
jgi:hemerythrin-like domain-containing protein